MIFSTHGFQASSESFSDRCRAKMSGRPAGDQLFWGRFFPTLRFAPCGANILASLRDAYCRLHSNRRNSLKLSRLSLAAILMGTLLSATSLCRAQRGWRQATDAELASLIPARAHVEKERIETELRTASGIINNHGHYIAGVVLLTAGYSAEGKYSHFFIVQCPVRVGGVALKPGEYALGWSHAPNGEELHVRIHEASTGTLLGTAEAHHMSGSGHVVSLRIWPPAEKSFIQIGRFAIPYELGEE